ncbi:mediator of DNA damage checkpoint protein 1 isoform X2 [Phymastichus coffea]|uniref:mediator of DNA damage checkpoint protein 1 isoform X2 n=1 Tax=Phymastichus coffea TaxID=108790 RepID=UPI00273AA72F|nr:mediator of DNA damage checkpoint protein 1 isoform X2 [Phymastichus coffea]
MDMPATQAMDDEDFVPTQKVTEVKESENSLIGSLVINDLHHHIYSGITIIGRQPDDCAIVLNDETVSRKHAEIEAETIDRAIFIKDLGSSNKTKINDKKIRPNCSYQIRDNDELNFGRVRTTFKIHQPIEDSFIACTPQINRKAIIPDTPNSSMNNSSALEGDVSRIPETQADEDDSCFRRPLIPVRTSISNDHESPKHVPYTLDNVPSPLSNTKDDTDISDIETQKFLVSEKSSIHSYSNEDCEKSLNTSYVKEVLPEKLENQPLQDVETQESVQIKSVSSFRRSQNTSQSIEYTERRTSICTKSDIDKSNLTDVSIHSAATQKIENLIEDLETQPFSCNNSNSDNRKSANTSIHSAETQKAMADVSNESLNDIQTQKFEINNSDLKIISTDASIYNAATQKITPENEDVDDLETQKFGSTRASQSNNSHQIVEGDQMASNLSFSIQDIDTMPFTKHELSLAVKLDNDIQNKYENLLDSTTSTRKSGIDKEVESSDNSKLSEQIPTLSKKSNKSDIVDEINENIVQNQMQANETLIKSITKSLHKSITKFDKSKSFVENDDHEEEIFSQNLIENCPFPLLLNDSTNDDNEQSAANLQNDKELGINKTVDNEHNNLSNNEDNSTNIKNSSNNEDNSTNLIKKKSSIVDNDDSETDEEGAFSSNLFKGKKNEKSHKKIENDSETDEEGVFSNHLTEEGEKLKSKPEGDSETDEEGFFSGHSSNNNKIIDESESEDEGVLSRNQSKSKTSKVDSDESVTKAAEDSFTNKSTKKVPSKISECCLNKVDSMVQAVSSVSESDDDIFDEINSSKPDIAHSEVGQNDNDNKDVVELVPMQIVETENMSLAPTQIVNTNQVRHREKDKSEEAGDLTSMPIIKIQHQVDELAPTQLIETQNVRHSTTATSDLARKEAQEYDHMDVAPTQKLIETQDCAESLAPNQEVVNTQNYSEEMGTLQFSESLVTTQIVENEPNDVENEIATSPSKSANTTKRQLEIAEITSNKKLKTLEGSPKINVDINNTVEQNHNKVFEGSEEKNENIEVPIETKQPENILESNQMKESSATDLESSISKPSPTLSSKKSSIRSKIRRRRLTLNKSGLQNETLKSVINLNDTIEQNLNELFDNSSENVKTLEPEPMLTQQLEHVLNSQDSSPRDNPIESAKEEGKTCNIGRKKSLLSLSPTSLNNSIAKFQNTDEKFSSKNVQSISTESEIISVTKINEKSQQNQDYSANLKKDNVTSEKITSKNDKTLVYRRGTIGFTDALEPVSRNGKTTSTTTTSRTSSSAMTNRTKRTVNDGDDDDESIHQQPSPKRTKILADHRKLQQVTSDSTNANKRATSRTLDNSPVVSKITRTDSHDMAVESNIIEDKNESKYKSKIKSKPAARTKKAKIDISSKRKANLSKENLEESDVQKPRTRGKGRRNQTTDLSVLEKESSRDEISASDSENNSVRSTRSRLVRQAQRKKEEKSIVTDIKVIQESNSETLQKPKNTTRINTRGRSAKTVDKSSSSKINEIADSENDKTQDTESQSSSQSESVTTRTTRKKKINQKSDSGSSETNEVVATTRGSTKKSVNNKSDVVYSNTDTTIKYNEMKAEINVFKYIKKKIHEKSDETDVRPTRKTYKNASAIGTSSSEESQEVSEIMKNVLEDSKKRRITRKRQAVKSNLSHVENRESSDDVFEKPTLRPKRSKLFVKSDKNISSHVSDTDEDSTHTSHESTRRNSNRSANHTSSSNIVLTPSRSSKLTSFSTKKLKVLFTGEKSDTCRQILTKLGGVVTEEFDDCSVLVTDKVRRTLKFLCSLARGIPIASVKWLQESGKAHHFLDLEEYILSDPEAEAKFKFNLKKSLDKARKQKLLEGYTIVLSPKVKEPPVDVLKKIIISSGGKPLVRAPVKWPEKSVVVTTQEELDSAKKLIEKASKSVTVQSVEFILTGILRQNINLNEFRLLA